MAILDRISKIIYTGGNIAWLPNVVQGGGVFYFRHKKEETTPLDTLEQYKKVVSSIGYEVVELEEISKKFGVEIIEIGKSVILIDGVIVDCTNDSNNIGLSFVKIACKLGFCNDKSNFAHRKKKLKKTKRNVSDLEVFLDVRKNNSTKKYNTKTDIMELQKILKQNGLEYSTYANRIGRGWDKHRAMTTPFMPSYKSSAKESVDHEGRKFESVRDMIRFHGISRNAFYKRKSKGFSLEQCLAPTKQKINGSSKSSKTTGKEQFLIFDK